MMTTFLGVVAAAFYGLFSAGCCFLRPAHENLRASQIIMQKAEALQLFTWSQVCDTNSYRQPLFVETLAAPGVNRQYAGHLSAAAPRAGELAKTGHPNLSAVTVTLSWTDSNSPRPIVHKREVQTRLARNGMPKYVWGAL
jgi:hypothetical protein